MALVLLACLGAPRLTAQTAPAKPQAAPPFPAPTAEELAIQAASEKDRQHMMDLLGIRELRPGVNADPNGPDPVNYDESKADMHLPLPDVLVLANGKRVTTAKVWWRKRRPQIVALFDEKILGRVPADVPKVNWRVASVTREKNGDVPVITQKLVGHVDNSDNPAIAVDIGLTLSTPTNARGPVSVIMEFGFSREFMEMLMKRFPQFKPPPGPTWQQQVLARGWGYAEYIPTSVQPDDGAGLREGIIGLANKGRPRKPDDWGALRAWAGARAARSTILKPIPRWMRNRWASRSNGRSLALFSATCSNTNNILLLFVYTRPRVYMSFQDRNGNGARG